MQVRRHLQLEVVSPTSRRISAVAESSTCRKTFGRESKNLRPGVKFSRHFPSGFDGDVLDGDCDSRGEAGTADAPPVLEQVRLNARGLGPRQFRKALSQPR